MRRVLGYYGVWLLVDFWGLGWDCTIQWLGNLARVIAESSTYLVRDCSGISCMGRMAGYDCGHPPHGPECVGLEHNNNVLRYLNQSRDLVVGIPAKIPGWYGTSLTLSPHLR